MGMSTPEQKLMKRIRSLWKERDASQHLDDDYHPILRT